MKTRLGEIDWGLLLASLTLCGLSWVTLRSVGGVDNSAGRQLSWVVAGLLMLFVFAAVDYRTWGRWAPVLFGANAALLVVVLIVGHEVHGSRSWLGIGSVGGQPSELMKVATVLLLARALSRCRDAALRPSQLATLAVIVGVPIGLVAQQPDMGTALTFALIAGAMIVVGGLSRRTWAVVIVAGVVGLIAMWSIVLKDYQKARIHSFWEPDVASAEIGYQVLQSRIAIGSGGLFGKGFAKGTQSQLDFLPEQRTDFIFAVIAESWGFLGSILVLGLYAFILTRGFRIALQSRDAYGAYVAIGIMATLAIHVLVNLSMVMGLFPTIGIPLPLLSYGGSSMVTMLAGTGLVLNVGMRRLANG